MNKMGSLIIAMLVAAQFICGVNSGIIDEAEQTTPFIDRVLTGSNSTLVDGMDSGWVAAIGSVKYMNSTQSQGALTGSPAASGYERLRLQKTFSEPLNLTDANLGFWMRTTGTPPLDLTFYIELYDVNGRVRQWRFYQTGDELAGSSEWSYHFIMSTGYYQSTADVSRIRRVTLRFITQTSSEWNISFDELREYPVQRLFPRGAVILTFDGPYTRQFTVAEPALSKYGYSACLATALDAGYPELRSRLGELYAKGWDISVYSRMFTTGAYPWSHLSREEFLGFALTQKAWLDGMGFTRSSGFLHCNRHLLDVYVEGELSHYFNFVKGTHWLQSSYITFPSLAFTGASHSYNIDVKGIERAAARGEVYVWFNHLNGSAGVEEYTDEQFMAFVDKIHSLGLEVVTWSQFYERYSAYLDGDAPLTPTPMGELVLSLGDGIYSVVEDGVEVNFTNKIDALVYLSQRLDAWGGF